MAVSRVFSIPLQTDPALARELLRRDSEIVSALNSSTLLDSSGYLTGANGIVFPATQVASGGANTLDDYEEGTWTPTDGSGASLSFTTVIARYIKVGRIVQVHLTLTYPATANGSSAILTGLPFASTNNSLYQSLALGYSATANLSSALVLPNSTQIYLYNGTSQATNANLTGAAIYVGGTYEAAS